MNHPAPESGLGPECDKFSADAMRMHFEGFLDKLAETAGPGQRPFRGSCLRLPKHADDGIRHFSGTASYSASFEGPGETGSTRVRYALELGRVEVIAEVSLNHEFRLTTQNAWKSRGGINYQARGATPPTNSAGDPPNS
jgi:hypothetical protein